MKKFLLCGLLLAFTLSVVAQEPPPPPDACPPSGYVLSSFCATACVLCDGLDGFVNTNESMDLGEAPPGFCAPGLHNTQWVGFVAGSTNLALNISVSNCIATGGGAGNGGLQIGIYNTVNCENYQLVSNCESQVPPNTTQAFNATGLIPGGIYFLVVDGFDGDICEFEIDVVAGSTTAPDVSGPAMPMGPTSLCTGSTGTYFANVFGAGVYEWTVDGTIVSYDQTTEIFFPDEGTYEVCVTGTNPCSAGEESCITVTIEDEPLEEIGPIRICEGEFYEYQGMIFSEEGTESFTYTRPDGCEQTVEVTIDVIEPFFTDLGTFELCNNDPPVLVNGQPYGPFDGGPQTQMLTSVDGCDSTLTFNIQVNPVTTEVDVREVCLDDIPPGGIQIGDEFFDETDSGIPQQVITTNEFGCDNIINVLIWVGETPEPVVEQATICDGEFYELGFAFYDQPGTYSETLETSFGCDSVVQVILDVYYDPLDTIYQELCFGESMVFDGSEVDQTGTYSATYPSAELGCDSTVTLELTILEENATFLTESICDGESYQLGPNAYDESGDYIETFTDANGCDSVVYLELIVIDLDETVLTETICAEDTYTIASNTYDQTGTYTNTFTGTDGCDSTVVLNLTVNPAITTTLNESICDGDIYTVGAESFDSTGQFEVVLTAADGCDSTVTLNLQILEEPVATLDIEICEGDTYTVGSSTYDQSGSYTDVVTAVNGCDSTINLNLTVIDIPPTELDITICTGQTYTVGSSTYTEAGFYTNTLAGYLGCDSVVNLTLAVEDVIRDTLALELCEGESYTVGSSTYTETGFYSDDFVTADGCDSTFYLDLTVNPTLETFLTESICDGESFQVGPSTYTTSGSYSDTFTSAVTGCDSIVYLDLTVLDVPVTNLVEQICDGESFTVGSSTYTLSGNYQDVLVAANGCDSIINLDLTVLDVPVTNLTEVICDGETYTVGTSDYTLSGNYQDVLTAANGCDSIVNLDLTVLDIATTNLQELICAGDSYMVGSSTYTTTGLYTDTLLSFNGCDSIVTLDLFVADNPVTDIVQSICVGSSFTAGGQSFDATGTYQVVVPSQYGCDSTINLTLTVTDFYETNLNEEICDGETYTVGTSVYDQSGSYTDMFTSTDGCDSLVNLNLIVHPIPVTNLTEVICDGEEVIVGGVSFTTTGTYQEILTAATGCDSIVNLDLTVNEVFVTNLTEAICDGESVMVGTSEYTASGAYTDVLTSSNGCDSTVNLDLTVYEIPVTDLTEVVCFGDTYTVGSATFSASGSYTEILTAFTGCDSIVNLDLTVNPLIETNLTEELCFGETYTVGTTTYDATGQYTEVLTAADGCDSIVNLDLTVPDLIETNLLVDICEGETYEVGTASFDATGIYQEVLTSVNTGCDSVVNLDLTVIETIVNDMEMAICDGESVTVGTSTYTTSGSYTDVLEAVTGCDSIVNLDLTVYEIPVTDLTEVVCFGDTYTIGNTTFSASGSYTEILTAYTGCDSIVNLDLTVNPLIETNLTEIVCFDDTYQVGNSVYDASGSYTDVLTAADGCDSIVNLDLTVRAINETFLVEDICDGEIYTVGNSEYTVSGSYQDVLTSTVSGCDSFVNLSLNVIELEETFLVEEICDGESFTVANSTYTTSGSYTDVIPASTGCDSTIYLELTVYDIPVTNLEETICEGDEYAVGTSTYTQTGGYQDVLTAYTGCDSIVNLDLFVIEQEETFLTQEICDGDTYEVGTSSYAVSGDYIDVITSSVGCDSIVYLSLTVNDVYEVFLDELICNDESYTVGNTSFNETGSFTVPLQSISGCDSIVQLNLTTHPCQLDFAAAEKPASCNGEEDGSINFEMTIGVPPYDYEWESLDGALNGSGSLSANGQAATIEGVPAGNYRITVIDFYGVELEILIEVTQPEVVVASTELVTYDIYNTSCYGVSDGIATASAVGGTPPYAYIWSHGSTQATAEGLSEGTYYVTVVDQNGCESVAEATLNAPAPLGATFETVDPACYGDETGMVMIDDPEGGVAPYLYQVNGQPFSSANSFGNLGIGTHTIAMQDANGCIWEEEIVIQQPEELIVDLGEDIRMELGDSMRLDALTSYPVDSFAWDFIPRSGCINCPDPMVRPLETVTYHVTVTDENGCTDTDEINIFVNKPRDVFIPNVFSPNNDGQNDLFMIFGGRDVQKVNSFIVFNRWGEAMFEAYNFQPNAPAFGWNGTHRGREMNTGVYVFLAEIEFIDGEVVMFKGDVSLIR